jgi:hypothetical protein
MRITMVIGFVFGGFGYRKRRSTAMPSLTIARRQGQR